VYHAKEVASALHTLGLRTAPLSQPRVRRLLGVFGSNTNGRRNRSITDITSPLLPACARSALRLRRVVGEDQWRT
jgi:hypothetical protein